MSTQGMLGQYLWVPPASWVLGGQPGTVGGSLLPSRRHSPISGPFFVLLAGQAGPTCLPTWLVASLPQATQNPIPQTARTRACTFWDPDHLKQRNKAEHLPGL